ncbi:50S ribosomal protein L17 [Flavobacteriaceae bacterium]|jgi:large subunit ribosomal protein L17|nr:50S ribosomal protein L17 [Flavobacteriaceae bacterium]MDA7711288.1 50S ribosomal protein L17 [Flavobacteriaceae bacterium]MDB4306566.1 50S ribosomal protein L17 [Flavobacteriaceae bacterium]
MRHGKKFMHLGRKKAHRASMLSNMACSLIEHKRINTTVTKAKALKQFVEPIITKAKSDSTHNRRLAFSALRNKYAVSELFREVADKVGDRPGGYTRIIKLGNRLGDNADMAMIELVDFNAVYLAEETTKKKSRRGGKTKAAPKVEAAPAEVVAEATEAQVEAPEADAEAPDAVAEAPEATPENNTEETDDKA